MEEQKIDLKKVICFAGAFIASLIGSGFATGQEIMQYFISYGYWGYAGALVVFILFLYAGISFCTAGYEHNFPKGSFVYTYYCGKKLGKFYDYFSTAFLYMSFIVMIAGAGATLNQQYNLPVYTGGILIACLAGLTVTFGLGNIVDIIGKIGPVIIVMTILLGVSSTVQNYEGLKYANDVIPSLNIMKASTNWLFAAGSYVGFCMLWFAAFLASIGAKTNSRKEASLVAIIGATAFSAAVIVITMGLMASVEKVAGSMIPSVILAANIHPALAAIFSIAIIMGIYTSSVPLLWAVSSRISNEGTGRFKLTAISLAAVGALIGLNISFDQLVNVIYVFNGYVGMLLLFIMFAKSVRKIINNRFKRINL